MDLAEGRVAASQQVEALATLGVGLDGLLEELYGRQLPVRLLPERVNGVVHPSQLALDVGAQVVGQLRLLEQVLVGLARTPMLVLKLVQVCYVELDCGEERGSG